MAKPDFMIENNPAGFSDVPGFLSGAAACDIRQKNDLDRLDVALWHSPTPCTAAGVFTTNAFAAPPVRLCRELLQHGVEIHGIVANSGNANACTGAEGMQHAREMQKQAAFHLNAPAASLFVCSTGRIGVPLPMENVCRGIEAAARELSPLPEQSRRAARAILTSDTREKLVTVRIPYRLQTITIAGVAKGAGMIEPGMATMLAFIATDARIATDLLQRLLSEAVHLSFNAITVDGDMSTNDSAIALANGVSAIEISPEHPHLLASFTAGLNHVCAQLAEKIVGDGEKITKVVEILVSGAARAVEAEAVARCVGNSLLVKSSWYGGDPNWGRILDAAGYSGVAIDPDKVTLQYRSAEEQAKPVAAYALGRAYPENKPQWKEIVANPRFTILLDLGAGSGNYRLLASDLTEGYVHYNKSES